MHFSLFRYALVIIIHFWNFFVRGLVKKVEKEMELYCDDFMMKKYTAQKRKVYSNMLLSLLQESTQKKQLFYTSFTK